MINTNSNIFGPYQSVNGNYSVDCKEELTLESSSAEIHYFQKQVEETFAGKNLFIQKLADPIFSFDSYFAVNYASLKAEYRENIVDQAEFNQVCTDIKVKGNCFGQAWTFLKNIHNKEFIEELLINVPENVNFLDQNHFDLKKWIDPHDSAYLHYIPANRLEILEQQVTLAIEALKDRNQADLYLCKLEEFEKRISQQDECKSLEEKALDRKKNEKEIFQFFEELLKINVDEELCNEAPQICGFIIKTREILKSKKKFNFSLVRKYFTDQIAFFIKLDGNPIGEAGHALAIVQPKLNEWFLYDTAFGLVHLTSADAICTYLETLIEYFEVQENINYTELEIQALDRSLHP